MSENMTGPAHADRAPTPAEDRAAVEAADSVDVDTVEKHFREMTDLGASVKGEGQIEPD